MKSAIQAGGKDFQIIKVKAAQFETRWFHFRGNFKFEGERSLFQFFHMDKSASSMQTTGKNPVICEQPKQSQGGE